MQVSDYQMRYKRNSKIFLPAHLLGGSIAANFLNAVIPSREFDTAIWNASPYYASGDTLRGTFMVPRDWDPRHPLGVRLHWTTDKSSAHTFTWAVTMDFVAQGEALAASPADTALDTALTIATHSGTAYGMNQSPRGIKNGRWLSYSQVFAGAYCQIGITGTNGTIVAASNPVWLCFVEIDYVPMLTRHPHRETDCPLTNDLT